MTGRILLFIPAYNCGRQLPRVLAQLTPEVQRMFDEVLVVDNRSGDDTLAAAESALRDLHDVRSTLLRNDENVGLGGSHKVAIGHALDGGFDYCVVLHGDDQASIADVVPLLLSGSHLEQDALLGSRFMTGARLDGYSAIRTVGNRVFNVLFSAVARRRLLDLGSGLNVFRVAAFADGSHLRLADDLTFNYDLILLAARRGWSMRFFPISWREEDQRSNVKMLAQSRRMVALLARFARDPEKAVAADHSVPGRRYTSTIVYDSAR